MRTFFPWSRLHRGDYSGDTGADGDGDFDVGGDGDVHHGMWWER